MYDNGELEVTGGFLLPDGTLISESSDLAGGLRLPFSRTTSAFDPLFELIQTGRGSAGAFRIDNPDGFTEALSAANNGSGNAIKGLQTGTGRAGLFQILNESSSANALGVTTNGTGRAGNFSVTNVDNGSAALVAETVGRGRAGLFEIANSSSGAEGLRTETNGRSHAAVFKIDNTANDSSAVQGSTNGAGPAVEGVQRGAEGTAGDFRINRSINPEPALVAETPGTGPAVRGLHTGTELDSSAHAAFFEILNTNSRAEALLVETNGQGQALEAVQTGTGSTADAGFFRITNAENDRAALRAKTFGTGLAADLAGSKNATVRNNPAGNVALVKNTSDQSGPDVLGLQAGPSNPGAGVNYVTFYDRNKSSVGAIEGNGDGGVRYKTSGADYAEALPVRDSTIELEPSDLVGVRRGTVGLSTRDADRLMVVTGQAAVLGNVSPSVPIEQSEQVPVAFIGQVPVNVRGAADPGDWIVASGRNDGTARAVDPAGYRPARDGQIAGQVWSKKTSSGIGEVTVAVGLGRAAALAGRLQEQQDQIDSLRSRVRGLEQVKARQERMAEQIAVLKSGQHGSIFAGVPGSAPIALLLGVGGFALGLVWRYRMKLL